MKLKGTRTIPAPQQKVWRFLTDPDQLAKCMPGCESLQESGENEYRGEIKVGVAAVKGVYNGTVRMEEIQPPAHYKLNLDGKGRQGFLNGSGTIDLVEQNGQTILTYRGDVQIGGLLASVGQRMVDGAAKMLIGQFFTALEAEIQAAPDEEVKHGTLVNLWRAFVRWLNSLFGKGSAS